MTKRDEKSWSLETQLVHGGTLRSQFGETSEAIFLNSGFTYDNAEEAEARFKGESEGYVYSRYANPTVSMFEKRMCLIEGAEDARSVASGMAAVHTALLCQLKAGDHVISPKALFGSCRYIVEKLMPQYGIESTLIDGCDLGAWERAIRPNTKVFFLESPTNPALDVIDIAAVSKLANQIGAKVVVDNVFATPLYQHPLELGAHIVTYSATKHIDGQGRCLGGIVLADKAFIDEHLHDFHRHTGPALSPFNAWTLLKGLESLALRCDKMTNNAAALADVLASSKKVKRTLYPHHKSHPQYEIAKKQMTRGSSLLAFEIEGGKEAAFRFTNALGVICISNNLGDAKSLITHPATTTHKNLAEEDRAELGLTDGFLRLSVGLENTEDLIKDIEQALSSI